MKLSGHRAGVTAILPICFVLLISRLQPDGRSVPMGGENAMTTRETVQGYFTALKEKRGWESFLSDDIVFTSFAGPVKRITGKNLFVEATKRFYSSYISFELRDILVEGERACVLTRYELRAPNGNAFSSDVAEIFTVKDGKINSFGIYFDSAPYPK